MNFTGKKPEATRNPDIEDRGAFSPPFLPPCVAPSLSMKRFNLAIVFAQHFFMSPHDTRKHFFNTIMHLPQKRSVLSIFDQAVMAEAPRDQRVTNNH
jgi:hypothetical protein